MPYTGAPDWYEVTCKPVNWFDGWLGIYSSYEEATGIFEEAKKRNKLIEQVQINKVKCLPPGDYFIGDLCHILDNFNGAEEFIPEPFGSTKSNIRQLNDGTIYCNFMTASGDGIWEDECGVQYKVDSGTIGAYPRKAIDSKHKKLIRFSRLKFPAQCGYCDKWSGCIKIGQRHIFTDFFVKPTKSECDEIFASEYNRRRDAEMILKIIETLD